MRNGTYRQAPLKQECAVCKSMRMCKCLIGYVRMCVEWWKRKRRMNVAGGRTPRGLTRAAVAGPVFATIVAGSKRREPELGLPLVGVCSRTTSRQKHGIAAA